MESHGATGLVGRPRDPTESFPSVKNVTCVQILPPLTACTAPPWRGHRRLSLGGACLHQRAPGQPSSPPSRLFSRPPEGAGEHLRRPPSGRSRQGSHLPGGRAQVLPKAPKTLHHCPRLPLPCPPARPPSLSLLPPHTPPRGDSEKCGRTLLFARIVLRRHLPGCCRPSHPLKAPARTLPVPALGPSPRLLPLSPWPHSFIYCLSFCLKGGIGTWPGARPKKHLTNVYPRNKQSRRWPTSPGAWTKSRSPCPTTGEEGR